MAIFLPYPVNWRCVVQIRIKILTPVHIGSGVEISPSEYLIDKDFHRINTNSLFTDREFKPFLDKFIEIAKVQRYIGDILPHSLLKKHILYSIPITGDAREYLQKNKIVVKAFIKTAGKVYIPGSSLKGCILSAIFWQKLRESYNNPTVFWKVKEHNNEMRLSAKDFIQRSLQGRYRYDKLLDFVFFQFASGKLRTRFAHWLDVVDSESRKPADVLQISLARVKGAKSGSELPIIYETLKTGIEFTSEVKSRNTVLTESNILSTVNQFYRKILDKDKSDIKSSGILLRLGQGSTVYATSCLLVAEELNIRNYKVRPPATKKRIDEHIPLGWIEIMKE